MLNLIIGCPCQTDKEIKTNRPDIVVKDKKERTCLLIDMSINMGTNTFSYLLKTVEKLTKLVQRF